MIIGASIGGTAFLILIVVANTYLLRRIRRKRNEETGVGLLTDCDSPILNHDDDNDMIM